MGGHRAKVRLTPLRGAPDAGYILCRYDASPLKQNPPMAGFSCVVFYSFVTYVFESVSDSGGVVYPTV